MKIWPEYHHITMMVRVEIQFLINLLFICIESNIILCRIMAFVLMIFNETALLAFLNSILKNILEGNSSILNRSLMQFTLKYYDTIQPIKRQHKKEENAYHQVEMSFKWNSIIITCRQLNIVSLLFNKRFVRHSIFVQPFFILNDSNVNFNN